MQILPNGKTQFIDQNGMPLVNGSVAFYAPGTSNPLPTYQDSGGATANTNPIQLDSRGQAIIWGNGTYRQVVYDANGVLVWDQIVSASVSVSQLSGTGGSALIGMADGSTLASNFLSNLNHVVDSIGALRALSHKIYTRAFVTGYTKASDGGGGAYQYDPNDTATADNGGTVIVASDGGRWKLQITGPVSVKQFGAKVDGTTDDTVALRAAKAWGSTYIPNGVCVVTDYTLIATLSSGGVLYFTGPGVFLIDTYYFPVGEIDAYYEIPVPAVFPTIQEAITYVEGKVITQSGFCSIRIADGTYSTSQIEPHFPTGKDRVEIIGNTSAPGNVVINCDATNNQCAFIFQRGSGISIIDGLTINGVGGWASHGVWNSQCWGAGIAARYGAYAIVGGNVRINKFYYGLQAKWGSIVSCNGSVQVTEAGDVGFHAYGSSAMFCGGCYASYCADTAYALGFGFMAEGGSFMDCSEAFSFHNGQSGVVSQNGSGMWAHSITSHDNGLHGCVAQNNASMECITDAGSAQSNSYSNAGQGFCCFNASYMNCNNALANQNSQGGFLCSQAAMMDITIANASNNTGEGFAATKGGVMNGNGPNAFKNTLDGFYATLGGQINTNNSAASNSNGVYGYHADDMGVIVATGAGGGTNGTAFRLPTANGFAASNGAYIQI